MESIGKAPIPLQQRESTLTNDQQTAPQPEIKTFTLLRFFVRDDDENQKPIIPRVIKAYISGRNVPSKHNEQLRQMGLAELTKRGRKRPGKTDSGEQIELPNFANFTARTFLDSMKEHGLKVVSLNRKVEPVAEKRDRKGNLVRQAHNKHITTVGIGWGTSIEMSPEIRDELMVLMRGNWANCYVWDNTAPRKAGVSAVDTVNMSSPRFDIASENELVLDANASLTLLPVGDAQLTLRTTMEAMPPVVTGAP